MENGNIGLQVVVASLPTQERSDIMQKEKWVVTTESGYRKEWNTEKDAIEDEKMIENCIFHPIAYIHKENTEK